MTFLPAGLVMAVARPPLCLPIVSLFAGTLALAWRPTQFVPIPANVDSTVRHLHCAVAAFGLVFAAIVEHVGVLLVNPNYEVARPSLAPNYPARNGASLSSSIPLDVSPSEPFWESHHACRSVAHLDRLCCHNVHLHGGNVLPGL